MSRKLVRGVDRLKRRAEVRRNPFSVPRRLVAWYYVSLKRVLNGDRAGPAEAFRKAVATGEKTTNEYDFAEAELKDLGR